MIGSLIGGAMKIGGSIFGGMKASKAMKRVKRNIQEQRDRNESRYNQLYNEDPTEREAAQRILSITHDRFRNRNQQLAGTQAVMGGTAEAAAAEREANNAAMADAASQIAVNGERRKDAIEADYRQRDAALQDQLINLEIGKANAISQATQGVAGAGAGIADVLDSKRYDE